MMSSDRSGDVMFAQMMIPHHEQAIQMADMALKATGVSPQVRSLAQNIKKAQAPEIATMNSWLTEWKAPAPSSGGHMGSGMMSAADMRDLGALSGPAFDKKWLTMMIAHHKGAIQMADQVLGTTHDAAVRKLANNIVTTQKSEIATMQNLVK